MGNKYNLSENEVLLWQQKICNTVLLFKQLGDLNILQLAIIWIYEYMEALCVNKSGLQAKLTKLKEMFPQESEAIVKLFHLRGDSTHDCYRVSIDSIWGILPFTSELDTVLKQLGFYIPICTYVKYLLTSDELTALEELEKESIEIQINNLLNE